ncbi:MAG: hypothetical protein JNJ61_24850 [Anaerolineae bacterium]|nr:hypothetical protein [Anaerolineae bacterium]
MKTSVVLLLTSILLLAACQPAAPKQQFSKGSEVAFYDFTEPGSFEEGTYEDGSVQLEIRDGRFNMSLSEGDSVLWYAQWGATLGDVVIDVETNQLTDSGNTVYGVMCRTRGTVGQEVAQGGLDAADLAQASAESTPEADATAEADATPEADATAEATPEVTFLEGASNTSSALNVNNGDGYLFLVEGSGRFAIMRSIGRNVTPLVDWTSSGAIRTGAASNRLRAVCLGSYLALYINDQFVGDATDDRYIEGQVGFVAAAATRSGVQVQFDNLSVSTASAG